MTKRLAAMGQAKYTGLVNPGKRHFNGVVKLHRHELEKPLAWKKPSVIFVNSMSDLFHRSVPDAFIFDVLEVMRRAHWHTFQVLTKRSQRVRDMSPRIDWPANVWMGVSVEDEAVTNRIADLSATSAAVKFLSMEPLIGPVGAIDLFGIDWVIVGGESGHGARPMREAWAIHIREQCSRAGVPFFFKQAGAVLAKAWGASGKGADMECFPKTLQVREMPVGVMPSDVMPSGVMPSGVMLTEL